MPAGPPKLAAALLLLAGGFLAASCSSPPVAAPATGPAAEPTVTAPLPSESPGEREGSTGAAPEPVPGEAVEAGAEHADAPPRRRPAGEPVRRELIVVDPGSSQVRPEPGELARRTSAGASGSAPRITNENLSDYARGGQVTIAGAVASPAAAEEGAVEGEADADAVVAVHDEAYWRRSARELREEWRRTLDEIAELEEAAADLRWRFYAEDDPWMRDGQIKPEWDRVLDRLSEARRDLPEYPRRLEELIERGRHEGALPGWLREGIELEPTSEELPGGERDPAEPVEPPVVDEGTRRDAGGASR